MKYIMTDNPKEQDIIEIRDNLIKYNLSHIELKHVKPIVIIVNDENANKIGGISATTHGNWLEISFLWVDEKLRGQKIGLKLLQDVEEEAIKRGCKYSFLDTFSFQARDFYIKSGYKEVLTLDEYPLTSKRHYFVKQLIVAK
ncbi:GNAT family N-acetyltransferase [Alkaliphilus peptidifermentans]|uniref:Acetyltransferase (GNAT) family protein n=1 Tax=Alkaliphilus peptidifermentans DSM 18978 TaxID=1120976 RepID=A0A1G5HC67_9FIRM|nr:GNAT family N-acetyltransferase [Alkaliphilus peptidifermentans]SCY61366.1 Acetyltransferase (GNAT) family protein [Alkaliphilus peptidifermentans DSM 18978]